jgi:hypothetical protein
MTANGPLLIGNDGSATARTAIDTAARLHPGATTVVLYARQPLESLAAHLEGHAALKDLRGIDQPSLDASERLAAEGADLARTAGLTAEPRVASRLDRGHGCGRHRRSHRDERPPRRPRLPRPPNDPRRTARQHLDHRAAPRPTTSSGRITG